MENNNIEQLKDNIREYIKQNGNKEITGQILQEVLLGMVDGLVGNDAVANPEGEATETLGKLKIGETIYTAPQGPQGPQGLQGVPGTPGANAFVHIKYAAESPTSDNDMHDTPQAGDKWMGVYSGSSATAPTTYTSYEWSKYVGEGGGADIFDSDVQATDAERLQALANVSNQDAGYDDSTPPVFTGKMGYVVLQPEKADDATTTFAAQIADKPNTSFEIRDVFDLVDETLTVTINPEDQETTGECNGYNYYISNNKITLQPNQSILLPHNTAIFLGEYIGNVWRDKRNPVYGFYTNDSDESKEYWLASINTDSFEVKLVKNIEIPSNCTLLFNGGMLKNAAIRFNNTLLDGNVNIEGVRCLGKVANESIDPMMLGAKGDGVTNDTLAIRSALDICDHVVFSEKTYLITCAFPKNLYKRAPHNEWGLIINRSNVIVDFGKAKFICDTIGGFNSLNLFSCMVGIFGNGFNVPSSGETFDGVVERIENVVIRGGIFIGARSQSEFETQESTDAGENYCILINMHTNYTTIEGVVATDAVGDCIHDDAASYTNIIGCRMSRARRSCVVATTYTRIDNCVFIEGNKSLTYPNGTVSKPVPNSFLVVSENSVFETTMGVGVHGWSLRNCFIDYGYCREIASIMGYDVVIDNNYITAEDGEVSSSIPLIGIQSGTSHEIHDITISNNTVIYKGTTGHPVLISIQDAENVKILKNTLKNVRLGSIQDLAKGLVIAHNVFVTNSEVDSQLLLVSATLVGNNGLEINFSNNVVEGYRYIIRLPASSSANGTKVVINNNIITRDHEVYITDRIGDFNLYITNNYIYQGSDSYCFVTNSAPTSNRYFLVKGNTFVLSCMVVVFSTSGSNRSYANGDVIGNYFYITSPNNIFRKLQPNPDFTGVMRVIGNTFKGVTDSLTEETISNNHLVLEDNHSLNSIPTTYSIDVSGVDANISINNNTTSVNLNDSYLAALAPETGYTIDDVVITMGGNDVTNLVLSTDKSVIYIPAVVGNVVITATVTSV